MVAGADKGPLYASKQDARVTRIGGFIRRCRVDELPQLFNVLRGDMSFIGPRAMWTQITDGYDAKLPYFQLRHLVRPGLTGWAQVNFHYGGTADDMLVKLEYDLWYIKNQSLFLDLWIVIRTIRVVLFGIGAQ
jgi:lipopolysaccharide/colanic/teichoic acid biosynthesis glycosyltransferase